MNLINTMIAFARNLADDDYQTARGQRTKDDLTSILGALSAQLVNRSGDGDWTVRRLRVEAAARACYEEAFAMEEEEAPSARPKDKACDVLGLSGRVLATLHVNGDCIAERMEGGDCEAVATDELFDNQFNKAVADGAFAKADVEGFSAYR